MISQKMKSTSWIWAFVLVSSLLLMTACGGGSDGDDFVKTDKKETTEKKDAKPGPSSAPTEDMDAGADPSVPAEKGGAGFSAIAADQGWETNTDPKVVGSPNAKKGGSITYATLEYPAAFRYFGKNSNFFITRAMGALQYESLLEYDLESNKYAPALATHWKISEDSSTYYFRLDPRARWSDGRPVIAEDVVATYDLLVDKGLEDTYYNLTWPEEYERPVAESKYIVSVKAKKENWRSFLYFAGGFVLPSYHLSKIDGAGFLEKYQYQMIPGTGPYDLDPANTKQNEVVVIKRRDDYWAKDHKRNTGAYNFDEIRFTVVREPNLQLEKFKKGEFDFYIVNRAQWWKEEVSPETNEDLKRGLIQRHKIYNFNASGLAGLALNTTKPPFDDIRLREAMSLLFDFKEINEKLFFSEYQRITSYFPNGAYANPTNKAGEYNPEKAMKLFEEAGWTRKKGDQWLTNAKGESFKLELMSDKSLERIFVPYQEDLKQAGIKLDFNTMDGNERFKKLQGKEYNIAFITWGGLSPPNPRSSMHSKFGKSKDNTNVTGLADPEIDKLLDEYDVTYDGSKRVEIIRQIDKIAYDKKHYVFGWGAPYTNRVAYWNKYNMPESGFAYADDFRSVFSLWWYDEDKAKKLEQAKKDKSVSFPVGEEHIDYWKKRK